MKKILGSVYNLSPLSTFSIYWIPCIKRGMLTLVARMNCKHALLILLLFTMPGITQANEAELNRTLVRIINQLNAVLPMLDEAAEEIEPNSRIQLHIENFEGSDGKKHAGVRNDLLAMRNALIAYINKPAIEPKTVKPLAFDFIGK